MRYLFILFFSLSLAGLRSQTMVTDSFAYGSVMRDYDVYVPTAYTGTTAVPLILNLHGYGSDNYEQELYTGFMPIADTANFIMVYPNGTDDGSGNLFWNAFSYPSPNDLGFLSALIDTIEAHYNIDVNAVYSTGMSNGGFMSYDLACGLSHRIAAIASVTGDMIPSHMNTCLPAHPMPVMQIHGTADATVPYNGNGTFEPVDSLVKHWVVYNHCSSAPVTTAMPDINTSDGCTATHYVYTGGTSGATVEFFKVSGGGHSWPGAPININTTCMDFNASAEIWRFFRQYRLNNLTGIKENTTASVSLTVYPNPNNGTCTVKLADAGKKTISLINGTGQVLQQIETSAQELQVKLAERGMYVLRVQSASGMHTQKIIRE